MIRSFIWQNFKIIVIVLGFSRKFYKVLDSSRKFLTLIWQNSRTWQNSGLDLLLGKF